MIKVTFKESCFSIFPQSINQIVVSDGLSSIYNSKRRFSGSFFLNTLPSICSFFLWGFSLLRGPPRLSLTSTSQTLLPLVFRLHLRLGDLRLGDLTVRVLLTTVPLFLLLQFLPLCLLTFLPVTGGGRARTAVRGLLALVWRAGLGFLPGGPRGPPPPPPPGGF